MVYGPSRFRILALIEASSVTGPVKNLLEFASRAGARERGRSAEFMLVTFSRTPGAPNPFVSAARDAGLGISVLHESRRFDWSPAAQLRRIISGFEPHLIQSHNVKSNFFVRTMGLHKQLPWLSFHHGYTATDLKDVAYNQFDRWSMRAAHRVVCVCEPFARKMRALGIQPDRIRIRHNSVRPFVPPSSSAVEEVRREFGSEACRVVLSVGRLSAEKGHADLLHAFAKLTGEGNTESTKLVLLGDGPERQALTALANELRIAPRVCFAGHRADVRPFYSAATLLALPSHSEGSPNVVLEAMSAGVPVAATAVGGVPEIVTDSVNGVLAQPHDPPSLASAIKRLLDDETLRDRLALAARDRIQTSFTPEAYCDSMLSIYSEAFESWGGNQR